MPRKKSAAKKAREEAARLAEKENVEKKQLDLGSDEEESGELQIDEEYAKRFQHNKEREELHRLQDKYGKKVPLEDEESSTSEEEDEFGDLVTEEVDQGINEVLRRIRDGDTKELLDPKTKFFEDPEAAVAKLDQSETSKPMHLKDYQRQAILDGAQEEEENEEKPYAIQQSINKEQILSEISNMAAEAEDEDDEDDDGFLKKREVQPEIEPIDLDPTDESKFLEDFISKKAWIPTKIDKKTGKPIVPTYDEIVDETDDDDEFDDIADKFENAYNFRYEDPSAAEIVSYARDQNTIRRKHQSARKRQREKKKEAKKQAEEKYETEINRLRKVKTKEVLSKLQQLQEAIGDEDVAKLFTEKDLEGDFMGSEWDKRMQEVFNEEFYSKKEDKPDWADPAIEEGEDYEPEEQEEGYDAPDDGEMMDVDEAEEPEEERGRSKTQIRKEEKAQKARERKEMLEKAEKIVDENMDVAIKEANISAPDNGPRFRYREVSPDSFGLTARDILLASDKDLNKYVGLKALATYRDPEKKKKDRRKFGKKKRLNEWRKSVFNDTSEPSEDAVGQVLRPSKKRKR